MITELLPWWRWWLPLNVDDDGEEGREGQEAVEVDDISLW